jgi:spore germination cell wall hydrolase CwlJ-like protein
MSAPSGGLPRFSAKRSAGRRRFVDRRVWIALAAALLVILALGAFLLARSYAASDAQGRATGRVTASGAAADAAVNLPPPDLLRPLTPEEAQAANAERPIVAPPDDPASGFVLNSDAVSRLRAIDCLTQTVYYEAASEGVDGGRAVAQVVLNRMRHPSYPNSVCGVVYQGSNRTTGCQFTFTCDGSLARAPVGYLWARSRQIASEALAGRVFAGVGHATHYHANYVLPYWADSLDKTAIIGRHIFYRFRGAAGSRSAFRQRYAAVEPAPPPPPSEVIEQAFEAVGEVSPNSPVPELLKVEADRVEALGIAPKANTQENLPLAADLSRGQLILGEPAPAAKPKVKASDACRESTDGRIKSVQAEDLKAGRSSEACS